MALTGPVALAQGVYSDFTITGFFGGMDPVATGTGTFPGNIWGMPDFDFEVANPEGEFRVPGLPTKSVTDPSWVSTFGSATAESFQLLLDSPADTGGDMSNATFIMDFSASGGTPAGSNWGVAVIDLEMEDAVFSAVDTSNNPVPTATVASWFQNVFDNDTATNGSGNLAQWDAGNAALVAEFDSDGLLDTNVNIPDSSTREASGWLKPGIPLNSLSIEYRYRGVGTADSNGFLMFAVAAPIPESSTVLFVGVGLCAGLLGRRR